MFFLVWGLGFRVFFFFGRGGGGEGGLSGAPCVGFQEARKGLVEVSVSFRFSPKGLNGLNPRSYSLHCIVVPFWGYLLGSLV